MSLFAPGAEPRFTGSRDIILVYGTTGAGKTRWTRAYLKTLSRVIILDPMREHRGELFDNPVDMARHIERHGLFKVRSEFVDDFPVLCYVALAATRCALVVEEAQRAIPSGAGELSPWFEDIVYRGRHRDVSLICVSQRPSTVHIVARSQWTRIICFHQTEGQDVKWLENVSGFDVPAHELQPGEYFDITPRGMVERILPDQRAATRLETGDDHSELESGANQPGPDAEPAAASDSGDTGDKPGARGVLRRGVQAGEPGVFRGSAGSDGG